MTRRGGDSSREKYVPRRSRCRIFAADGAGLASVRDFSPRVRSRKLYEILEMLLGCCATPLESPRRRNLACDREPRQAFGTRDTICEIAVIVRRIATIFFYGSRRNVARKHFKETKCKRGLQDSGKIATILRQCCDNILSITSNDVAAILRTGRQQPCKGAVP